jgi:uncharacterized membrane protein YedE/YeeE
MVPLLTALLAGLVFGTGLLVSGLAQPAKVLAFLDLAGPWDPSLALVMAGAMGVAALAFALARQRRTSLLGLAIEQPPTDRFNRFDGRLVGGSALFGIGWGLVGLCPGPALLALGTGQAEAVVFVLAMLAGMGGFEWLERRRRGRAMAVA